MGLPGCLSGDGRLCIALCESSGLRGTKALSLPDAGRVWWHSAIPALVGLRQGGVSLGDSPGYIGSQKINLLASKSAWVYHTENQREPKRWLSGERGFWTSLSP